MSRHSVREGLLLVDVITVLTDQTSIDKWNASLVCMGALLDDFVEFGEKP